MSYSKLSDRQQVVLDMIMDGGYAFPRLKTIAKEMCVHEGTIKKYLQQIYMRYGIPQRAGSPFIPSVRPVYLRSKELGLL